MYADDIKIFSVIKSQKDIENIQSDLNALSQWTNENRLSLKIAKCSVTSFYKIRTPVTSDYFISLNRKNVVKDLWVIFDSELSFSHHINHVVSKASNLVFERNNFERNQHFSILKKTN